MNWFLRAIHSRAFIWVLTWVVVAASFAFTVYQLHQYSDRNREQATASTRHVLIETCEKSGNGTRKVLRTLLNTGKPQLKRQLQMGKIDQQEYKFQLKQLAKDKAKVQLVDCKALYSKIH